MKLFRLKFYSYRAILLMVGIFLPTISNADTITFVSDLSLGSRGQEVLQLQRVLNSDPETQVAQSGVGSVGSETDYFGLMTKAAVVRFQEKYSTEILMPLSLVQGTGVVGARTRAVLNRLQGTQSEFAPTPLSQGSQVQAHYPIITAVTPSDVPDPENIPVTITGQYFTQSNKVFLSVQDLEIFNAYSSDGQTITLLLTSSYPATVKAMVDEASAGGATTTRQTIIDTLKSEFNSIGMNGVYVPAVIFVQNEHGESNKIDIRINVLKDVQ